jgi:hypothetical protein
VATTGVIEIKLHRFSSAGKYAWVAAVVVLALALPASAAAADPYCEGPTGDQYCPDTQVLTASGSGGDPADPSAESDSALPFTGFDVVLSLVAGAGLLGVGLALRRVGRSGSAA